MKKISKTLTLTLLPLVSASVFAATERHIVVAPNCLLKNMNGFQILASQDVLSLISTNEEGIDQLIKNKNALHRSGCGGFIDVTAAYQQSNVKAEKSAGFLAKYAMPKTVKREEGTVYTIKYEKEVGNLLSKMNPEDMWKDLQKLTSFPDRYSRGDNGVKAAAWIKDQVETMAKNTGHDDVKVYYVATGDRYKQPSIVAKLGNGDGPGVVVGGHMDTLQGTWGNMPGADDDGSGSVTVLETARMILGSGMTFKKPVYFVWYSAEELGLIGSQYVVADFKSKKIPVDAVLQLDMTGYQYKNEPTIWLMDDYVNKELSDFTGTLITTYAKVPVKHSRCGYACSDHASWTQGGFKSSMPFETEMNRDNPDIHTSNDVMSNLSLEHMTSFVKMATAFVVEMAEPVGK